MAHILRIGIVGLGEVGGSTVVEIMRQAKTLKDLTGCYIQIVGVSAINRNKKRQFDVKQFRWFDNIKDLAQSPDIDVLIELVGGTNPDLLEGYRIAQQLGKHIITANKELVAEHALEFFAVADKKDLYFGYEASVCAGLSVIAPVLDNYCLSDTKMVCGIFNGTTSYILWLMEQKKLSFQEALEHAKSLGYAEKDCSDDINGLDSARKLVILSMLLFRSYVSLNKAHINGINDICLIDVEMVNDLNYRLKLISSTELIDNVLSVRVLPALVEQDSILGKVEGVDGVVAITSSGMGLRYCVGSLAGGVETAQAVLSDIIRLARSRISNVRGFAGFLQQTRFKVSVSPVAYQRYYLRIRTQDSSFQKLLNKLCEQNEAEILKILKQDLNNMGVIISYNQKKEEVFVRSMFSSFSILSLIPIFEWC